MTRTHIPIPKPTLTKKPVSRLRRGGSIKPVSAKRVKLNRIYKALSEKFLKEHPICQHWLAENGWSEVKVVGTEVNGYVCVFDINHSFWTQDALVMNHGAPRSAEIHHKKGRGKYLLDTSTWMAVRPGHSIYIHLDPLRYEKGYCLPRN